MPRKYLFIAAGVLALLLAAGAGYRFLYLPRHAGAGAAAPVAVAALPAPITVDASGAAAGPAGKLPSPVILVLDRAAIRNASKVGQDITRQLQALTDQARRDLAGQEQSLQAQATQLQQASNGLTPEQRQTKGDALQAKQADLQAYAQRKQAQLTMTMDTAYGTIDKAMEPIVAGIVKQHGGNLVLDRMALPYAQPSMDITAQAIAELDAKQSSYHVTLAPAPQGQP